MTSKQVMLTVALVMFTSGCKMIQDAYTGMFVKKGAVPLESPYPTRHVWAVAPLRNESGSLSADGLALADHLVNQLENAANLDVLPVNRTLKAMEALEFASIESPQQALRLLDALGIDGLIVGTVTAFDPYDPPKLGMAIELYVDPRVEDADRRLSGLTADSIEPGSPQSLASLRRLTWSATQASTRPSAGESLRQPVSVVSAFFNGSAPEVKEGLRHYAHERGLSNQVESWHTYRISMDLYSEFVTYVMSWRMLRVESRRVAGLVTANTASP